MLDSPKPPTHDAASAERFAARRRTQEPSASPAIDAFVAGTSSDPIALLKKRASLVRQLSMKLDIDDEASVERRRELAKEDSNLTALLSHKHHMSSSVAAVVALNHHLHPAPPTDATLCGRLARCCGRAPAADAEQPAAPSIPPPTPTVLRSLGAARTVDALRAHTRDGPFAAAACGRRRERPVAVSYTHLTLPTKA